MATINGTNGNDNLTGTAAADRLNGRGGDDVLTGRGGNDTLEGGIGIDTLNGGAGNDLYIVTYPGGLARDTIVDSSGRDTAIAVDSDLTLPSGIEILILQGNQTTPGSDGAAVGHGNELDNTIRNERTGSQRSFLDGQGGDDVLVGGHALDHFQFTAAGSAGFGDDFADGGGGDHDILLLGNYGAVVADFADGFAREGTAGTVTFVNVEEISTGKFNDRVTGDAGANSVFAGAGNDTVSGGSGNDIVYGDRRIFADTFSEYNGRDQLAGDAGNDSLFGGNGNDTLDGGSGRDFLAGGAGNDRLRWDAGDLGIDGGSGTDRLLVGKNLNLASVAGDQVVDVEAIDMTGAGNNRLTLKAADLLALSSETDEITVFGNPGDSINIVGQYLWQGLSNGFHRYQVGDAILLVDPDISSVA